MTAAPQRLVREVFTTSRLLDFCSERELVVQTGHRPERWPLVAVKELVDNGLDIAEEAEVAPQIAVSVSTQTGEITVSDNGPGITTETIDSLLDFTARTSSRAAYVGPSRGQQGHALQTILAMPFVLDGGVGETVIQARGIAHCIRFTVDPIRQEPRIACDRATSSVKNGTRVTIRWPRKAKPSARRRSRRFFTTPLVRRRDEPSRHDPVRSRRRDPDRLERAQRGGLEQVATERSIAGALVHP